MENYVYIIQYHWRRRMLLKKTMYEIARYLYLLIEENINTYTMIDEYIHKNVDTKICIYNKIAKRRFLESFELTAVSFEVVHD